MPKAKSRPIDVEIYDQKYSIVLQSPLDEAEVRSLPDEVDERMREISRVASTADSLKVAILTALHLAHDLRTVKKDCEQTESHIRSKSVELSRALEQVLKK